MDIEQESEWSVAQNIKISEDLVAAAKLQLQFLAVVDRNRWLYEGPALQWAMYRYNVCWLPLLAKHSKSQVTNGPLVVPLDCEWVWHCHRLNPVRYKSDCEEFYGRILDNCNVASSVQGVSTRETEEIWNKLYPNEPYDIDLARALSKEFSEKVYGDESFTKYNLVLAIERQSPFFYQVSRPHVNDDLFLEASVARYKGFLHLIKRNKEQSIRRFCVPTYDIDLIWHTHQLHPASYCNDSIELLGNILEHDDTDQDRGKGQKLDVGFSSTTKQWEETFGSRYWRAGAMYRGTAPSPITTTPFISNGLTKKVGLTNQFQRLIDLPKANVIEVVLEFVEIKNLPEIHKTKANIFFSKAQPDGIFNIKRKLNIQSESGQKHVAVFQCQPTGHLFFELISHSDTLGYCFIPLEDFFNPVFNLSVEKWFDLVLSSVTIGSEPIRLRVAASCTVPIPAPHVLQMDSENSCFFQLPGKDQLAENWTRVTDEIGNKIINLQMRNFKEVIGMTKAGETLVLGRFLGSEWSLMDSLWSLKLQNSHDRDAHLLLTGPQTLKLVPGRKLAYECTHCEKQTHEHNFMTVVEFSAEYPYGRAIALLDINSGILTLEEAWFALPGIVSVFIVSSILKKEGCDGVCGENVKGVEFDAEVAKLYIGVPKNSEAYGGGYKNKLASGGCGSGCGSGCGNTVKSGGCGSGCGGGCGGGCGNMVKSGGCGGGCGAGCGSGCGNMVKSGGGCGAGCGGGCGGGCGNMVVKSGGCGGCGGGGCGNIVKNEEQPMQVAAAQA